MEDKYSEKLELHYYFKDSSHSMDAFIRHKSETHFLAIIKELSNLLQIEIDVESEALAEGGLTERFKVSAKTLTAIGLLVSGYLAILQTVPTIDGHKLNKVQIENIEVDTEVKKLELEKLKRELKTTESQQMEVSAGEIARVANKNSKIVKQRSNFFETLNSYPKISAVSFGALDANGNFKRDPIFINRKDFEHFIITSDELPVEKDENASIAIVSPVLKKGNYKWKGIYKDSPIDFFMKDEYYKESIVRQEVAFKNGTFIDCELEVARKITATGDIKISSYTVIEVYFTREGERILDIPIKKKPRIEKPNYHQTSFFNDLS